MKKPIAVLATESNLDCTLNRVIRKYFSEEVALSRLEQEYERTRKELSENLSKSDFARGRASAQPLAFGNTHGKFEDRQEDQCGWAIRSKLVNHRKSFRLFSPGGHYSIKRRGVKGRANVLKESFQKTRKTIPL